MENTTPTNQAMRNGVGLPWGLVDFEALLHLPPHYAGGWQGVNWSALEEMVRVLDFGAKKYSANNWKKGSPFTKLANSFYRHTLALIRGERTDRETGFSHYGHVLCNLMFVSYWCDHKPEFDDRPDCGTVRDTYIPDHEPQNEAEALAALLQVFGGFMNGVDVDPSEELHLLGYAMHYACLGYAFQNRIDAQDLRKPYDPKKPLELDEESFLGFNKNQREGEPIAACDCLVSCGDLNHPGCKNLPKPWDTSKRK